MQDARTLTLPSADGLILHGRIWEPPNPRALIVVSHGYGEHGGPYADVAASLVRGADVAFLTFDYRGHGLSPGKRGVVNRYDDLVGDLRGALAWAGVHFAELPKVVLGHSNGGLVALCLAAEDAACDGLILSNPSLQLAARVPWWKRAAGRVLTRVAPEFTLDAAVRREWLSSDPEVQAAQRADPLRHGRISGPLFFGMLERGKAVRARPEAVRLPLLMMLGGEDRLIDPATSAEFFDRIAAGDKTLRFFAGSRHELFHDIDRDRVLAEIRTWLADRFGDAPTARTPAATGEGRQGLG